MSRTTRKQLHWGDNEVTYNPHSRDNKPQCNCCGNRWQKQQNKRDRATIKRNLRNPPQ